MQPGLVRRGGLDFTGFEVRFVVMFGLDNFTGVIDRTTGSPGEISFNYFFQSFTQRLGVHDCPYDFVTQRKLHFIKNSL